MAKNNLSNKSPVLSTQPIGEFFRNQLDLFIVSLKSLDGADNDKITTDLLQAGLDINDQSQLEQFRNNLVACKQKNEITGNDLYNNIFGVIATASQSFSLKKSNDLINTITDIANKISKALGGKLKVIEIETDGNETNTNIKWQEIFGLLKQYSTFNGFIEDYVAGKCPSIDTYGDVPARCIWNRLHGKHDPHTDGYHTPHVILTNYHLYKRAPWGNKLLDTVLPLDRRKDPLFRIQCVAQAVTVEKEVTPRLKDLGRIDSLHDAIKEEMESLVAVTDLKEQSPYELGMHKNYGGRMYIFLECLYLLRDHIYKNDPDNLDKIFEIYGNTIFQKFEEQIRVKHSERHWKQRIKPEIKGFLLEGRIRKMISDGDLSKCVDKLKIYLEHKRTHYHNSTTPQENTQQFHEKRDKLDEIIEKLKTLKKSTNINNDEIMGILKEIRQFWIGERVELPYNPKNT